MWNYKNMNHMARTNPQYFYKYEKFIKKTKLATKSKPAIHETKLS
jgi:hypothetical protein